MKKVFMFVLLVCFTAGISAQDCMTLFPTTQGATMTTKSYDANNGLISTTTYTIGENYEYVSGATADIAFRTVDMSGNVLDQGSMEARCDDGNFYLKQLNRTVIPDIQSLVFENIELMGNFLDYPDTFGGPYPFDNTFEMDGAEFTVKNKTDDTFMRIRVYNRDYEKNEKIKTPAGEFDAAKISYMVEVYDSATRNSKEYKGVEWYALGSGIVRSEIYDMNGALQSYNVLTDMSE